MKCAIIALFCAQQTAACNCYGVCVSTVALETSIADEPSALVGDMITVCRNSDCASATLGDLAGSDRTDVVISGAFSGDAVFEPNGSDISLEVQLMNGGPFHDGDVYSINITEQDSSSVFSRTGSAEHDHTSLCGTECSQATLEL
ncbi:MAG TPA: hypothetical protein VH143_08060 [Kofleriaceae bacterium]|nr:hypothetical protein [Kofleriaceae bacterium]